MHKSKDVIGFPLPSSSSSSPSHPSSDVGPPRCAISHPGHWRVLSPSLSPLGINVILLLPYPARPPLVSWPSLPSISSFLLFLVSAISVS